MKHFIFAATLLVSSYSFAGAAVLYNCAGVDNVGGESVVFELAFSDSAPGVGYTNQAVTVEKMGSDVPQKKIVFQMFEATKKNECSRNEQDEIYLAGGFDMIPTANGNLAAYQVNVKSNCADAKVDIKAYCFFQYGNQ
ncbi:MAG: hypothetical protein JSU04_01080 [Bdellovibrionales bacterium]|nr:hypothetical protein [Bdellovibrionales bacterium]